MPASDCRVVWRAPPSWEFDVRPPTETESGHADSEAVRPTDDDPDD